MNEKKIYAVGRIGKQETQTSFYKFFEHKEDAEKELKEIAKSYCKEDVKWNKHGDLLALNDYWNITEFPLY